MSKAKKHYIALTCEALARNMYAAAATAPHTISVRLFRQGSHNSPNNLRATLQEHIDFIQSGGCDAVLLAYGICGTSTLGLIAMYRSLSRVPMTALLYIWDRTSVTKRNLTRIRALTGTVWTTWNAMNPVQLWRWVRRIRA